MEELTKLQFELTTLAEFIEQRLKAIKKEQLSPEHLRMVSPPYERELIAATRIIVLIQRIYQDEQA